MLVSGVPARAWRLRRRLTARCCRHNVAFPTERIQRPGYRAARPQASPSAHPCAARRERALLRLFTQVKRVPAACEMSNLA